MYINKKQRSPAIDYSFPGLYFVTICTKNKTHLFGKIKSGEMILNELGRIAQNVWNELINHFEDIKLYDFIVMPNHIHGIINILNTERTDGYNPDRVIRQKRIQKLPVIISSYKSAVSREINKISGEKIFAWQSSYYDRLIRNEEEFDALSVYIVKNPLNWENDIEYNEYQDKSIKNIMKSEIHKYYEEVVNGKYRNKM
ncbi:MAG: transposase [Ignavibacteria bacterium]|nr:transposase [Ignavibacteria bacterium]